MSKYYWVYFIQSKYLYPNDQDHHGYELYAWTNEKKVRSLFKSQRDMNKYKETKMDADEFILTIGKNFKNSDIKFDRFPSHRVDKLMFDVVNDQNDVITLAAVSLTSSIETDLKLDNILLVLVHTLSSRMVSKNLWPEKVIDLMSI